MSSESTKKEFAKDLTTVAFQYTKEFIVFIITISSFIGVILFWKQSIEDRISKLEAKLSEISRLDSNLQAQRGPAGPQGRQGEPGPPGTTFDPTEMRLKIDKLTAEVDTLRKAVNGTRSPDGMGSKMPPVGNCNAPPEIGRIAIHTNDLFCSRDRNARAIINQIDNDQIRYSVDGKYVRCSLGEVCSFNWTGNQRRFKIISAVKGGPAELYFEMEQSNAE